MAAIIDFDHNSNDLNNEILFTRISNDLLHKGYSVNLNALPLSIANDLYSHITSMTNESFIEAAIGRDRVLMQNTFVRSQKLSWITGDSTAGKRWLNWASDLQTHLNRHLFLGLFSFESHYAHYAPGDFYKRHYDAFRTQVSRKVSIVVYLNRDWLLSDGGELALYQDDSDKTGLKVTPSFASIVVFLSEEFPHEVLPAYRDRYSIAGWYRINTTNETQIDPPQ